MSGGGGCECPRRGKLPLPTWAIEQRYCNHSAFNGRRKTFSRYSEVWCSECGRIWRTKAAYVDRTPTRTLEWRAFDEAFRALKKSAYPHDRYEPAREAVIHVYQLTSRHPEDFPDHEYAIWLDIFKRLGEPPPPRGSP